MPSIFFHSDRSRRPVAPARTSGTTLPAGSTASARPTPTATATSVEMAAPATPKAMPVHPAEDQERRENMLRITDAVETIIPGLKLPVPRSAAPIATIAN